MWRFSQFFLLAVAIAFSLATNCAWTENHGGLDVLGDLGGHIGASRNQAFQERYLEAWRLLRENTMYPERLGEWMQWEHKFDGKLTCAEETDQAIKDMINCLHDEYTYGRDTTATRVREMEYDQSGVVSAHMQSDNIAYINIKTFGSRHVTEETRQALEMMAAADAYIIDLRGNKGGCVDEAYKVFSLLVDKGLFTTMNGRMHGEPYTEELAVTQTKLRVTVNGVATDRVRELNLTGKKPVIILVNNNTRSASEMLAGALRDSHRARLVGSHTYGKGVVQNTWIFEDGSSLKIAIARYFLPSGICINGRGLAPDDPVPDTANNDDLQLRQCLLMLKNKLALKERASKSS